MTLKHVASDQQETANLQISCWILGNGVQNKGREELSLIFAVE